MLVNQKETWDILNNKMYNVQDKLEHITTTLKILTSQNYFCECRIIRDKKTRKNIYSCTLKMLLYDNGISKKRIVFRVYYNESENKCYLRSFLKMLDYNKEKTYIENELQLDNIFSHMMKKLSEETV